MTNVLITAGPTKEYIDPIRYISNNSSGKQGYALAEYMSTIGWNIILISGPVTIPINNKCHIVHVETCSQMLQACIDSLPVDIAIFTAAVTDWIPYYSNHKAKKHSINSIDITYSPDILKCISINKKRPKLIIGFSIESENLVQASKEKLIRKKCDWIIGNDLYINNEKIMGSDYTKISIITKDNIESFHLMTKKDAAKIITKKIIDYLNISL
ncbi:phosphopantothenoylcysteine decarboxylase [Neoehrlichia mikurensis]|uniref:Phosphopantothenoylcysteine decarboxylase n=1 Tax=Neoehrlichia mikurensis TaxID=89586 RepID=A0A9Q9BV55_9RICK|nr:phosphopantothenoylcysteine decarboxylase [Neoehrlichia mikurensis]QXK91769.1 phosphopantothenoylcysteine decarboxylase [Neoehrlichia mikurensis]QXK92982.1 phosphopantothenoylcysteine decarboxylase [Neoehrlichia mikurensis]QXK93459.1 phosphopantothenoylcysteine decarboxylase [Neoehrlichia mikurensis]UTO55586.1 phosphopantothenoylcysteine decarboxylase [Neoehrlichia mikurensis]UTO56507.1 phosphopantothenoylcysteine decarboxylase [Neoehrlichia mikurensis]